jgi:hypothetical protein
MKAKFGLAALLVSAMLVSAPLVGCGDMNSPKSTVASLDKALKAGDKPAARAAFNIKGENGGKAIDALIDVVIASQKLQKAAEAKFGQDAKGAFAEVAPMADIDKILAESKENVTENTATFGDMNLVKVDGKWLITTDGEKESARALPILNGMAKAMGELTSEIDAGKYKKLANAKEALGSKMMDVVVGAMFK